MTTPTQREIDAVAKVLGCTSLGYSLAKPVRDAISLDLIQALNAVRAEVPDVEPTLPEGVKYNAASNSKFSYYDKQGKNYIGFTGYEIILTADDLEAIAKHMRWKQRQKSEQQQTESSDAIDRAVEREAARGKQQQPAEVTPYEAAYDALNAQGIWSASNCRLVASAIAAAVEAGRKQK